MPGNRRARFSLLLSEGWERNCERTRAKRNDQFAAIIHLPIRQATIVLACAKVRRLANS